jgi:D-alanine-D-alanine ligase
LAGRTRRVDIPVLLLFNDDPAWSAAERIEVALAVGRLERALREEGHPTIRVQLLDADLAGTLHGHDPEGCIVVNWCEELPGLPRSEARVAGILEELRFAYTGSPSAVLSRCWDRRRVKARLAARGIPTPRWRCVAADDPDRVAWDLFPAIVKPAWEHCSVGISTEAVVLDRRELRRRIGFVHETFGQPAVVEEFIDGRELHVTVWGNGTIDVLPLAEMDFSYFSDLRDRLCTYDAKFTPGSAHYEKIEVRIPARLGAAGRRAVERVACRTYRAFACRDYARIDLRLRGDECLVLDVNPNPDLSHDTSTAGAAEAAGLSYGAFVSSLVNLAAERSPTLAAVPAGEAAGCDRR